MLERIYTLRDTLTGNAQSIVIQARDVDLCDIWGGWFAISRPRAARALRLWRRAACRDARYSLEVTR